MQEEHALPRIMPRRVPLSIVWVDLFQVWSPLLPIEELRKFLLDDASLRWHVSLELLQSWPRILEQVEKLEWHDSLTVRKRVFRLYIDSIPSSNFLLLLSYSLLELMLARVLAAEEGFYFLDPTLDQVRCHRVINQVHRHVEHILVQR